jgi:hypothetical protein
VKAKVGKILRLCVRRLHKEAAGQPSAEPANREVLFITL